MSLAKLSSGTLPGVSSVHPESRDGPLLKYARLFQGSFAPFDFLLKWCVALIKTSFPK